LYPAYLVAQDTAAARECRGVEVNEATWKPDAGICWVLPPKFELQKLGFKPFNQEHVDLTQTIGLKQED